MSFSIEINGYQYNNCWFDHRSIVSENGVKWYYEIIMSNEYGYPEPIAKINVLDDEIADEIDALVENDPSLYGIKHYDVLVVKHGAENTGIIEELQKLGVLGRFIGSARFGRDKYPVFVVLRDRVDALSEIDEIEQEQE